MSENAAHGKSMR